MWVCNMKTIQQMLTEISSGNWTYHLSSIKVYNRLKIKGSKMRSKVTTPSKGTPEGCVYAMLKQSSRRFPIYCPETYHPSSIKVNNRYKIEGKKLGQSWGMCVCNINLKQFNKHFQRYRPENELIFRHPLKSIKALKSRVKNEVKGQNT